MDARRHAAATERNREPILGVLRRVLPSSGTVLEIASGTGQHAAFFGAHLPKVTWQPSDGDPASLASIAAWTEAEHAVNVRPPLHLDVLGNEWPLGVVDALFCANMIHIAPWAACLGLLRGARRHLREGGVLVLYGPFRVEGRDTSEGNARFDAMLRDQNPAWGVRDLEAVVSAAAEHGLAFEERVPMPANNLTLVFRLPGDPA